MANIIAPRDPIFPSPQPSRLAAVLAVALKVTAIIALAVLIILATLFYLDYSRRASRQTIAPAPTPTAFDGARGAESNGNSLPAPQSGSSGNVYNEPAAQPTTEPQAYPLPNN